MKDRYELMKGVGMLRLNKVRFIVPFLFFSFFLSLSSFADGDNTEKQLFVYLSDGQVNVYPMAFIEQVDSTDSGDLKITLKGNSIVRFAVNEYDSVSYIGADRPKLESFRFDKKYNEQLTEDCEPVLDEEMNVEIRAFANG